MILLRDIFAMSDMVLLDAQKKDTLSMDPIGRLRWKPMRGSGLDGWGGIAKASFGMSSILRLICM